ncbi:hypothetical protein Pst134EA_026918 [Puccinia striiformis f. sp. tritici]|uniref:hypothetical protein n=1 Tax=Puccinia striiformis f. sp. tritici TaxID=168172 RepID=UPI0020072796|nr:hypothetical protein Pst134EA_026918 [Puccinia striiformis f. sp. tritici]KAH9450210.1 hypothetical protein Pst134EA_026918 [Puccinia striiformis f. sp. tritici]
MVVFQFFSSSTPSVDGLNDPSPPHDSNKAAHNVRIWLENWLAVLDDTEQFRVEHYLNGSSSSVEEEEEGDHGEDEDDHHGSGLNSRLEEEEEEHVIDQSDDNKPDPLQLICTCPHLPSLPEQTEEEEDKPEIGEEAEEPTVMKTKSSTKTSQVRVVIPVVPKQSPHRKKRRSKVSSRLSLPSTRRKKSMTPSISKSATRNSLVTPMMASGITKPSSSDIRIKNSQSVSATTTTASSSSSSNRMKRLTSKV